jgi:hypothetical protein
MTGSCHLAGLELRLQAVGCLAPHHCIDIPAGQADVRKHSVIHVLQIAAVGLVAAGTQVDAQEAAHLKSSGWPAACAVVAAVCLESAE